MHTSIYASSTDGLYLLGRGAVNIVVEILSAVGILTAVWGYFMVLVQASKVDGKNGLWLLGSVFLPPIFLLFVGLHWTESKSGFFIFLLGTAIAMIGLFVFDPEAQLPRPLGN